MPAIRTYKCNQGHSFEHYHQSLDEPLLDYCPICIEKEKLQYVPGGGHIGGSARSKAEKLGFEIAQLQYGLTDMKDSTREGETIIKPPPAPQGDARAINDMIDQSMKALTHQTPEQAKASSQFWSAGAQTPQQSSVAKTSLLGMARNATAAAKEEGSDAMHKFHSTMKKNPAERVRFNIIGKG